MCTVYPQGIICLMYLMFFFTFQGVDSEVELKFKIYQCHMKLREFRDAISIVRTFHCISFKIKEKLFSAGLMKQC